MSRASTSYLPRGKAWMAGTGAGHDAASRQSNREILYSSAVMLADLITAPQRILSTAISFAISAALPPTGLAPKAWYCATIAGSWRIAATVSLMRLRTGAGVLAGAAIANQVTD